MATEKNRPTRKTTRKAAKSTSKRTTTRAARKPAKRDPRLPAVGRVLTRVYKGNAVEVAVTEEGYVYQDVVFKSLSAVARRITGYPSISGPAFFAAALKPAEAE